MAIGARDRIDQLLVKKYAQQKVDNHENTVSMVDPNKMMSAMNDYAYMRMNTFNLSSKISNVCQKLNATRAHYVTSPMSYVRQAA